MEQEKTQIQKVAERLAAIHSETFGGKIVGRYRISRAKLLQLLNINMLRDKVIKELEEKKGKQEFREFKVTKVFKENKVLKALKVIKVFKG